MSSEIRVNSLTNRSGLSTVSITDAGLNAVGIITAHNFQTGTTDVHSTGVTAGTGVFTGNVSITGNLNVAGELTYDDVTNIDSVGIITARSGIHVTGGSVGIGTVSPGTNLDVLRTSNDTGGIVVRNTNNSQGNARAQVEISGGDNADGRLKIECNGTEHTFRQDGSGNLQIHNASAERLRITSGGDVSIGGLSSPRAKLDIDDAGTGKDVILRVSADDNNPYGLVVANDTFNTTSNRGLAFWVGSNKVHHISARTSETASENELSIAAGDATYFKTNNVERLRITGAGDMGLGATNPGADPAIGNDATVFEIRQTTAGNISAGNNRKGAVLRLKHEAQWENGYQNSATDDLGRVEFVTGDSSTGEGVRSVIRCRNLQYYNNHALTFEVANSNSATLSERLRIDSSGRCLIGANSSSSSAKLAVNGSVGNTEAFFELNRTDDPASGQNIGIIEFCQGNAASRRAARLITRRDGGVWGAASLPSRFEFHTCSSGSNTPTEKLRIASDGTSTFTGQRHKFIHNNSGGVGAYLSLFNTNATAGSSTGICFGIGGSDAVLDGTDYGESQIKVYSDSGNYGNMEINLHTGANRSYLKIVGNGQGYTGASAGTEGMRGGVAFGNAGIAIDRSWSGQPGIHVFNENVEGDTDQGTFRFHGWNRSYASYPGSSGSDFGVSLIADGMALTSDRRRKTGITTITDALNTVSQMRGVSFTYVNQDLEPQTHMSMDNGKKLGFIAQEVIPLLPELILDSGEKSVELENGYCDRYNMDYGGVTPLLVEAIKELKAKNEVLEARIAALE